VLNGRRGEGPGMLQGGAEKSGTLLPMRSLAELWARWQEAEQRGGTCLGNAAARPEVRGTRVPGRWPRSAAERRWRGVGRCCFLSLEAEEKSSALKGPWATCVPQDSNSVCKKRYQRAYSRNGINNGL